MLETFSAKATKLPNGLQVETESRNFKILFDEPKNLGGTDTGPNPVEVMLAALGACQTICAFAFAKSQGIDLKGFSVEVEGDLDADGFTGKNPKVRNGFSEIRFKMHFETSSPQDKVEAFADFIESRCPVGDNLANGVKLIRTGIILS